MNVAELGSRWSWWRGALVGVVLVVAAGVLGMHVLTAGHSAHGVDAGRHVSEHGATDPGAVAAHGVTSDGEQLLSDHASRGHADAGDHAASIDMPLSLGSTTLGGVAPADAGHLVAAHVAASAPVCDADCAAGMGSVCLAVLLLVLLLLRHGGWIRHHLETARLSLATLVPALGVGPPRPSLVQLCVSRT